MKNMLGLAIALSLALVAALLNWKYLERKSQELETVSFLAVDEGTRIRPGDPFLDSHFTSVEIPMKQVGQLTETAVLYKDIDTVIGMNAVNSYDGGEIILRQDLKTRKTKLPRKEGESTIWIPVDPNSFEPSLVEPGKDMVSFFVSNFHDFEEPVEESDNSLTPEIDQNTSLQDGVPPEKAPSPSTKQTIIGPFLVLALGKRLGSEEVHRASGAGKSRENNMAISVKKENDQFEPRVQKLLQILESTSEVRVILENPKK